MTKEDIKRTLEALAQRKAFLIGEFMNARANEREAILKKIEDNEQMIDDFTKMLGVK